VQERGVGDVDHPLRGKGFVLLGEGGGVVDGGDPGACGGGLFGAEDLAEVCVGENGIDGEVRVVLFDEFPDFLLCLGFAGAVDGHCS